MLCPALSSHAAFDVHAVHAALQIDLVKGMMDCLYAECTPCITDCVMAELEKLGQKYRVALKVAKVNRARAAAEHHRFHHSRKCELKQHGKMWDQQWQSSETTTAAAEACTAAEAVAATEQREAPTVINVLQMRR